MKIIDGPIYKAAKQDAHNTNYLCSIALEGVNHDIYLYNGGVKDGISWIIRWDEGNEYASGSLETLLKQIKNNEITIFCSKNANSKLMYVMLMMALALGYKNKGMLAYSWSIQKPKCDKSPTGYCKYDAYDYLRDKCIFCGKSDHD